MNKPQDKPENLPNKKTHDDKRKKTAGLKEVGGRAGPEPTRYGDWENNGIASDF